jgi:hypothetical protein
MYIVWSPGFSRSGSLKQSGRGLTALQNLAEPGGAQSARERPGVRPVLCRFSTRTLSLTGTPCALLLLLLLLLCGCATPSQSPPVTRRFDFQTDTFAYPNELVWEYYFDADGKWTSRRREPESTYSHECFVVARSARQFFLNARFDPQQPIADEATYRRLIRGVVSTSPRHMLPDDKKIVIPGYANLREFSQACEKLLKAQCGGSWQSYFQRGHWRVVFPFFRSEQQRMADQLLAHLAQNLPLVVHVICFPELTINHAVVIFDA